MKIFLSAGEPSGDVHGSNLIRALQAADPTVVCVGYGGPRMAAAGCVLHADLTKLAVMWFLRALLNLHHFLRLLWGAERYFRSDDVAAVVLIDYPGFNWWIARCAKRNGIPVFYYGAPQLWAWAAWRVHKMRRLVDHILCKLPFEEAWYRQRGCRATYVGHPFFDETQRHSLDLPFMRHRLAAGQLVTILPGSRTQEVTNNLPWFLRAAQQIRASLPCTRFAIAAFSESHAAIARGMLEAARIEAAVHVGKTPELIAAADCCLACSGSVSLELLSYEKPSVILYHISRTAYRAQRYFRKVKYITLVNLLAADDPFHQTPQSYDPASGDADKVPFPEYLTCEDKSQELADQITQWLIDPHRRQRCVEQLRLLKRDFAVPGASRRAAAYILDLLTSEESVAPRAAGQQTIRRAG